MPGELLRVVGLTKRFGANTALDHVDLDVASGEVHALLGHNGSGKSTLIKCLAGVYAADEGSVWVGGQQLPAHRSPADAIDHGLSFVHQDLGLIPTLTVAENIGLGGGFQRRGGRIDWRAQRRHAAQLLDRFKVGASPDAEVGALSATQQALVAIARAADRLARLEGTGCLVLDEPTAALPESDAEVLFDTIRSVTAHGVGVLYVTHRLGEVLALADRATVLRDGRRVATRAVDDVTHDDLVELIVGAAVAPAQRAAGASDASDAEVVLDVERLSGEVIRDVSFQVHRGEIVGVAGLAGAGRSELARLIFGAQPRRAGTVRLGGRVVGSSPSAAMAAGLALVPEHRRRDGVVMTMNVRENISLASLAPFTGRFGWIRRRAEQAFAEAHVRQFAVTPATGEATIADLSGGNQQKVLLAKWLATGPRCLILDEPVQGIDVGAIAEVYDAVARAAADGVAILVMDSDYENLVEVCDRVLVLVNGRLSTELAGDLLTEEHLLAAVFEPDIHALEVTQ